jgi:hypothetical protein
MVTGLFDANGRLSQRLDFTCMDDDDDAMMQLRHYTKMAMLSCGTARVGLRIPAPENVFSRL